MGIEPTPLMKSLDISLKIILSQFVAKFLKLPHQESSINYYLLPTYMYLGWQYHHKEVDVQPRHICLSKLNCHRFLWSPNQPLWNFMSTVSPPLLYNEFWNKPWHSKVQDGHSTLELSPGMFGCHLWQHLVRLLLAKSGQSWQYSLQLPNLAKIKSPIWATICGNKLTTRWNLPISANHVMPNFGNKLTTRRNLPFLANCVLSNFGNKLTTRRNLPFLVNHVMPNFGNKLTTRRNLPFLANHVMPNLIDHTPEFTDFG